MRKMKLIALKDVCKINMGQSPNSSSYNDYGDGMPFFQGNADFGERYPITRVWCNTPTKIAQAEDILISVRAPIGALNYAKEECCIGRGLAAITPDRNKVSQDFIYWALKGKKAELNDKGNGSTFKAISRKILEETMIPDINFEQQHKCAENLEKIYGIIQNRRKELLALDDLITAKNVKMHHMTLEPLEYISKETYDKVMVRGFPKEGDVVFTTEAPLGNVCRIPHFNTEFYIGQRIVTMQTEELNPTYLEYALSAEEFIRKYMGNSSGSTVIGIRVRLLEQLTIQVPPRGLQDEFAIFVEQVDKSKVAVQKALDETQTLFDSLMQEYFG